jgi:hypothetical protein
MTLSSIKTAIQDGLFFLTVSAQKSDRFNLKIPARSAYVHVPPMQTIVRHQGIRPAYARSAWPTRMSSHVLYCILVRW